MLTTLGGETFDPFNINVKKYETHVDTFDFEINQF